MKKLLLIGFIIFLVMFAYSDKEDAWNTTKKTFTSARTNIGLKIGMGLPVKDNYSSNLIFGINFNFFLTSKLSVELSAQRITSDLKFAEEDLYPGTLTMYPIQLSLKYQFSNSSKFTPYLLTGVSYTLFDHQLDLQGWEIINFTGTDSVKSSLGFHGGLGFDFFISNSIALNLDLRYLFTKADCEWVFYDINNPYISASGTIRDIQIDFITATAGFKVYL
jgi:outer membrane protein W